MTCWLASSRVSEFEMKSAQVSERDTDVENKRMDTNEGKRGGGGGGGMNWEIGIDIYTLICIK